jgi:hypothetical protein
MFGQNQVAASLYRDVYPDTKITQIKKEKKPHNEVKEEKKHN